MENIIRNIIKNVLTALYQPFGAAVLLAFVAMFVFIYAKEHNWKKKDLIKNICLTWFSYFKKSCEFRRAFLLIFYSVMILSRTVLLLWAFRKELLGDKPGLKKTMWVATKTVGIFSFVIEFSQLLFHLGTFQISDLVYNTLGGTVGGLAYYIIYKFRHRNG